MINVVTALLTGQKEVGLHFIQQHFKVQGRKTPLPAPLLSNKSVPRVIVFPIFTFPNISLASFLNRLKKFLHSKA